MTKSPEGTLHKNRARVPLIESFKGIPSSQISAYFSAVRDNEGLRSFAELTRQYREEIDYRVNLRQGTSGYLCAAWHGGTIERGSDTLATLTAGSDHSLYVLQGLHCAEGLHPLHIASTRFDDSRLIELAQASSMVVSFHCCSCFDGHRIFIGGGASEQCKQTLITELRAGGFNAGPDRVFLGIDHKDPCNLGERPGLQIEVSRPYMDFFLENRSYLIDLASALRSSITKLR
jgi:phage replication-related protein YjqB (UPF0714/DUF867 family)